jgi:hypothetical protein
MADEEGIRSLEFVEAAWGLHDPETQKFWSMRAVAIQCYARLEQNLCHLFAELADINHENAGVIYFRINNTIARNAIIEKLFRNKFGTEYNLFRNSLIDPLRPIDLDRNQIVHWNVVNRMTKDESGNRKSELQLEKPTIWISEETENSWNEEKLRAFGNKCLFYSEVLGMFTFLVLQRAKLFGRSEAWHDTWREIFQRPITYPPPADHPSRRHLQTRDSPPQSSQA